MIYYYALKIKNQAMLFLMTFAGRKEPWMPQIIENFFENILFRYESAYCEAKRPSLRNKTAAFRFWTAEFLPVSAIQSL